MVHLAKDYGGSKLLRLQVPYYLKYSRVFWAVGKRDTNKHKHFGRDGVRDKQEPSLRQTMQEFQGATPLGATGLRGSEREICL